MNKEDVTHMHTCVCANTHTHTLEYYSAIKKNTIMTFTAT